jgi:hypothetical protein
MGWEGGLIQLPGLQGVPVDSAKCVSPNTDGTSWCGLSGSGCLGNWTRKALGLSRK